MGAIRSRGLGGIPIFPSPNPLSKASVLENPTSEGKNGAIRSREGWVGPILHLSAA